MLCKNLNGNEVAEQAPCTPYFQQTRTSVLLVEKNQKAFCALPVRIQYLHVCPTNTSLAGGSLNHHVGHQHCFLQSANAVLPQSVRQQICAVLPCKLSPPILRREVCVSLYLQRNTSLSSKSFSLGTLGNDSFQLTRYWLFQGCNSGDCCCSPIA